MQIEHIKRRKLLSFTGDIFVVYTPKNEIYIRNIRIKLELPAMNVTLTTNFQSVYVQL